MQDQQPGWSFQPGQQVSPQMSSEPQPAGSMPTHNSPNDHHNDLQPAQTSAAADPDAITWTASEYVAHEKSFTWFLQYFLAVIVMIGVTFAITRSIFTVVVLAIFAVGFVILAQRKPQVLQYQLAENTLQVGKKTYLLQDFKSFAIVQAGQIESITLVPMKRFMPALDIYFAPEDGDRIAEFLSQYLPIEHRTQDVLDRFMQKIRF